MFRGGSWRERVGWQIWLAGGLALLVILVLIIARLGGGTSSSTSGSHRSSHSIAQQGDDSVVRPTPTSTVAPEPAVSAAKLFMRAWLRPAAGVSDQAWWAGVSRYADPNLSDQLKLTDPSRVPATKLVGEPSTQSVADNQAVLAFDTDAGQITVTITEFGDGPSAAWKVSDIDTGAGDQ